MVNIHQLNELRSQCEKEPFEEWIAYHDNFYHFYNFNFAERSAEVDNMTFAEMKGAKIINFGNGDGLWEIYGDYPDVGIYNIDEITEKHQVIYFKMPSAWG